MKSAKSMWSKWWKRVVGWPLGRRLVATCMSEALFILPWILPWLEYCHESLQGNSNHGAQDLPLLWKDWSFGSIHRTCTQITIVPIERAVRKCSKDSEFTEAKTTSDLETRVPKKGHGEEVRQEQRHQGDRCCSTGVLPPGLQPEAVWPPCQLADYLCAPKLWGMNV